MPALNAYAESEPSETDPVAELVRLREANAFLLDYADELTVELEACEELLEMAENPPCDDGFPWVEVTIAALVGGLAVSLID